MLSSTFWHVSGESILLVALGQTIAFCEAKMLCLKANLIRAKALLPKVNLLLAKALLQKAALLDWSAPGLNEDNAVIHHKTNTTLNMHILCSNHLGLVDFQDLSMTAPLVLMSHHGRLAR